MRTSIDRGEGRKKFSCERWEPPVRNFPGAEKRMAQLPAAGIAGDDFPGSRFAAVGAGPRERDDDAGVEGASGAKNGRDVIGRSDVAARRGVIEPLVPFEAGVGRERLEGGAAAVRSE